MQGGDTIKRAIFFALIITTLLFSGCQGKSNTTTHKDENNVSAKNNTTEVIASKGKLDNTQYNFQPLKPGTVNQLNSTQKAQISSKVDSVISSINSSLNSLDDIKDIDFSSLN